MKSSISNKKSKQLMFDLFVVLNIPFISLPILLLDKTSIVRCIDIFKKYLKKLKIKDVATINKLLIFKEDFLTMRNVTRTIYQYQE